MQLTFLGTGAGLPSKYRNTQGFVFNFMQELKECWLFDCGEAIQHKIMHTTIKPSKIRRIFISHMHGDHILGLIGFLSSRNFLLNDDKLPLTIYGPTGIKDFVESSLKFTQSYLNYEIDFVEYTQEEIIYQTDKVAVEIKALHHTIDAYGFNIKFAQKKGKLLVDKLNQLGIKPGPFYKTIKEQESFTHNGITYLSKDFLDSSQKGKVISIINDTTYFDDLDNFVANSDILISECTYLKSDELELAKKHKHMNIHHINHFVEKFNFDKIYLTHISSRYDYNDIKAIQQTLNDTITIVNDLDEYII